MLEADGVWSYVFRSHTKVWLWIALSREAREVMAYHIERWNNTLRQHLARFVRKTLSFSKYIHWHDGLFEALSAPIQHQIITIYGLRINSYIN